ncbi:glycosyltransferase [Tabrizicola sp.]|uniref:glycosyltransferase n=1 Tax=Tabrizicola sp. TaxID=2005166 RepID=UPI0025F2FA85|nr:glycosyltransferase [Tabrizicola sp.]
MHVLQTTLLPKTGLPEALYLRLSNPANRPALPLPTARANLGIPLEKGDLLSTDTFFGSFYHSYWKAFTSIGDVAVVVGFRGRGKVRVFEDTGDEILLLCEYELLASKPQRHLIRFRTAGIDTGLINGASSCRLYVEVEAQSSSEVQSIDFVTEIAVSRGVHLSIGISTFNDTNSGAGSQIATILPALVRLAESDPTLNPVHLVNHGPPFTQPAMLAALDSPAVRLSSPAAGPEAPGGLARTLATARAAPEGATHHLVLADDILLDERLIQRAQRFLDYATSDLVLGSAMLDVQFPVRLCMSGAMLAANGQLRMNGQETDVSMVGGLRQITTPTRVDYCPWWFCILPLAPVAATPLPQGPFLRGDDFAYGLDQQQRGIPSLCLPGLGIWRNRAMTLPQGCQTGPSTDDDDCTYDLANRFMPLTSAQGVRRNGATSGRLHVLQSTLLPREDLPETLFLRAIPPRRHGDLVPRSVKSGTAAIRLDPGNILSTDTFFGSFYRAYWQAYTVVRDLAVMVEMAGTARVRIFEETGHGANLIAEDRFRCATPCRFLVDIRSSEVTQWPGEAEIWPSRLFVEVEADETTDVHAIDFITSDAPKRRVTLSIGLCTFNQEHFFARTLCRVARLAASSDAICAVHVVNQGAPFKSDAIRALLNAPKIQAIEQRNLGGCGGFTRTLVEELANPAPASHHLMMDDDIVLDERMILRALRFLNYADREIALGAGMFDILRPHIMYEAGAFLRTDNSIHAYCHDVDLSDPAQLWHFNTPVKTDYNAWWFCILPVERSRTLALPAPVFIRGDDFEYGQRLALDGVPTVTLPGIGVWHEPFYAKPSGWQEYYDLRNRLIFGATYADKVRQLPPLDVIGMITDAILTHNYMAAELRMKAVQDFLRGPRALFARDTEQIHESVMSLAKGNAPEKLDASWKQRPLTPRRPRPGSLRGLVMDQVKSALRTGFGPLWRNSDAVLMDVEAHPGNTAGQSYVLTNGPRSYHLRFVPRRFRMWGLMLRAGLLAPRYKALRASVGADWAANIAAYRSPDWWAATFRRPTDQAGSAATAPTPFPDAIASPQKQAEKI